MSSDPTPTPVPAWSDAVDDILAGDLAIVMAHTTPAAGVVITPVTNFALRDRRAGTVTVLSSLGAWRKLRRLQRAPQVALAFHTREHGYGHRPEFVLVQGAARFSTQPDRAWLESIEANWERFMGPRRLGPLWDRWMRVYHWERVAVDITVHRVTSWPDLACHGEHTVTGADRPSAAPPSQDPPANGTGPRLDHARATTGAARLPHRLLGWVDTDGFPTVVPVSIGPPAAAGMSLATPHGLVPPGARRAGLTSHWFSARVLGQTQEVLTGWLTREDPAGAVTYAPHTRRRYRLPPSRLLYRIVVGAVTRRGLRDAHRAGFLIDHDLGEQPTVSDARRDG